MARDRTAALRAPPAEVAAPPPPPDGIEEVVDLEREQRVRRVLNMVASLQSESTILRALMTEFGVPRRQAQADYADARDMARKQVDDGDGIDVVMLSVMAQMSMTRERFFGLSQEPIREHIFDRYGPHDDDPLRDAIYRPLTPGERASEIGSRVAAAKVAIQANEVLAKLVGRRSARWADRPSTVIQLGSVQGLSDEDKELLKQLGMGA